MKVNLYQDDLTVAVLWPVRSRLMVLVCSWTLAGFLIT